MPLAMPASVPMEQGSTIMPWEGTLPLAMDAAMSASAWVVILLGEAGMEGPSSFSMRAVRPLICSSSARTRSEASEGTRSMWETRASAWRVRRISAAKTEPLAPVMARVSRMELGDSAD